MLGGRVSLIIAVVQSVVQLCPTLCDPLDCSTQDFPLLYCLSEPAQTSVHWVDDAIWPSHPLSSPSPALNLSQHHGLFQWVSSSCQVAKVLELQLQHQSLFRVDFLWDWLVWSPCSLWLVFFECCLSLLSGLSFLFLEYTAKHLSKVYFWTGNFLSVCTIENVFILLLKLND